MTPLPWAPSSSSPSSRCCGILGRRLPHRPSKIVHSRLLCHPLEPRHEQLFSGVGIFSYFREIRDRTFSFLCRQDNPGSPVLTSLGPNLDSPTPALTRSSHLILPYCSGLVAAAPPLTAPSAPHSCTSSSSCSSSSARGWSSPPWPAPTPAASPPPPTAPLGRAGPRLPTPGPIEANCL